MTGAIEDAQTHLAVADSDTGDGARRTSRWKSSRWEIPLLILIAVVIALVIKTFFVQVFYIPSGSMEPTLHGCPGCRADRVLVNKLVYRTRDVRRGEVIVFKGPPSWQPESTAPASGNPVSRAFHSVGSAIGIAAPGSEDLVKRVIGIGGDHVVCCDSQGRITVNGTALTEPYIYPGAQPSSETFDVTVPKGRLWVMGDNRDKSADSRAHRSDHDGTIPESDVIGRAFAVIWTPSHWKTLPVPKTFGDIPDSR
jgi:signal peptidase I